jgi:hypothetical protein
VFVGIAGINAPSNSKGVPLMPVEGRRGGGGGGGETVRWREEREEKEERREEKRREEKRRERQRVLPLMPVFLILKPCIFSVPLSVKSYELWWLGSKCKKGQDSSP